MNVVEYDPQWPRTFETLRAPIVAALGGVALAVEHIGSTSVPGLAAKPIIDIDIIVRSRNDFPAAALRLASLGYRHRGNLGIEDREAFESPAHLPAHHLYLCSLGSGALENHLAVRDHLRRNEAAAIQYGELKMRLADRFPKDIDSYVSGKTDFILGILRRTGFSESVVAAIRAANEKN